MKLKKLGALCLTLALTLSLAAVPAHAVQFSDVPEDFWGYEYIQTMYNKGYAKGYEDGSFKPNGKMTAVETLLFCARAAGVDSDTQAKIAAARNKEVTTLLPTSNNMNVWAAAEMAVAVEAGVLSLTELEALSQVDPKSVKLDANGKITDSKTYLEETMPRENICMYLVRAMQLEPLAQSLSNYSLTYKYGDAADISSALLPYVYVLTNYGIVKGKDTGDFDPKGAVTRAEMTTMLCRALDFMADAGIRTELSEYTDYPWQGGVITAITSGADGSVILTLYSEAADVTQSYAVPSGASIYEDNMITTASALRSGQYVRLNLNSRGNVSEVRLGGPLTVYAGTVMDLEGDQLSVSVNNQSRTLTIDRFTQVVVGRTMGDRSLIEYDAEYTSAICYVDAMGHLAAVRFSGGTQLMEGLVESVNTANNVITFGVTAFDGTVHRYTLPEGIAVMVNGNLGELSTSQVGKYVKLRVANDSVEDVRSVSVDTVSTYVQGPIKKLGTIGTAKSIDIYNVFNKKTATYTLSLNAAVTYAGAVKTLEDIQKDWYATALVSNGTVIELEAYPDSSTVTGTLTSINYGTATLLQVAKEDGSVVSFSIDITDPPVIKRDKKDSSIDKLRTGDQITVTVRYNAVTDIEATSQNADLTGVIDKVTQERTGVSIEVTLSDLSTATYTVSEGVSVTQADVTSNIYELKPGMTIGMVTNGGEIVSIDITSAATSATRLTGTVLLANYTVTKCSLTLQVTDSLGRTNLVTVDITGANLMDMTGQTLKFNGTRRDLETGDIIEAIGSYDGATFIANIVIKQ